MGAQTAVYTFALTLLQSRNRAVAVNISHRIVLNFAKNSVLIGLSLSK